MKISQFQFKGTGGWGAKTPTTDTQAQLVMVFGETLTLKNTNIVHQIRELFPKAQLFGCSTAGEIYRDHVFSDTVCVTALEFESTSIEIGSTELSSANKSLAVGRKLAQLISHDHLRHVVILSPGLNVNGTELVSGVREALPPGVSVSGGIAGDNDRFHETLVIAGDRIGSSVVSILGFYGDAIQLSSASRGGWDAFGPERLITKSDKNILYELDGRSALELYKSYLGEHAKKLPGSALLFPLKLKVKGSPEGLVRTVLGIDESNQSMIFAGDLPQGSYAQFMMANFDRVIDGAVGAAQQSVDHTSEKSPDFALLISCVGRKTILKQRVDEEIEGVRAVFGDKTELTGFYSYGEISPLSGISRCELHNQTMTITVISETKKNAA